MPCVPRRLNVCPDVWIATRDIWRHLQVPTFIFYRNGQEVGRHVGSSRGDLIGKILEQQNAQGIAPPSPPVPAGTARRRSSANA